MSNRVVVVGSYNVDMTITTERLPKSGETVLGHDIEYGHGGKGANQAVAAARAGGIVTFIAKVGQDTHGQQAIQDLRDEGIDVTGITVDDRAPTGLASITVDKHGENCIVVVAGANARLSVQDITAHESVIAEADVLLVQLETPLQTVSTAVEIAARYDTKVIFNPAPAQELNTELLQKIAVITPNRVEAERLSGVKITDATSMQRAAGVLHQFGIELVLITLGADGVFVSTPTTGEIFPAIDVEVRDTVGAGDVFNGVFAAVYQGPATLRESVSLAIAGASLSVTKMGAQTGIRTLAAIKEFQHQHSLAETA